MFMFTTDLCKSGRHEGARTARSTWHTVLVLASLAQLLLTSVCAQGLISGDSNPAAKAAGPKGATLPSLLNMTEAYLYGLPIVLMEQTLVSTLCQSNSSVNEFSHISATPDATFTTIVKPNVDTLYSLAFLDLSQGPVVLTIPPTDGRYQLVALFDAWSNNFAAASSLDVINSEEGGTFVIALRDWEGELPDDAMRFDSPTPLVWLLIRTEVSGDADVAQVNAVQDSMTLDVLNDGGGRSTPGAKDLQCSVESPPEAVASMGGVEFFLRLSKLVEEQGALLPGDEPMLEVLAAMGVGPNATFSVRDLPPAQKLQLQAAASLAQKQLNFVVESAPAPATGWSPDPNTPIGVYGTNYFLRALVAATGFGANSPEFAVYQNADTDEDDVPLTGKDVYTLTFAANEQPPVDGFWSITVYNEDVYLAENIIDRYALGSNSDLVVDSDGSIVLTLSHEAPEDSPEANWLPIPDAPFELTLRMYGPTEAVFTQDWTPPRPQLQSRSDA